MVNVDGQCAPYVQTFSTDSVSHNRHDVSLDTGESDHSFRSRGSAHATCTGDSMELYGRSKVLLKSGSDDSLSSMDSVKIVKQMSAIPLRVSSVVSSGDTLRT